MTLPPLQALWGFIAMYGVYNLCSNRGSARSQESKALQKLCSDLNVETDASLSELLARCVLLRS